jgi:N-formylglutamate amidohydrolase
MVSKLRGPSDSAGFDDGGSIPGKAGAAAYRITMPKPSALPVLIAVPHAGRAYPESLLAQMRSPDLAALKLEDRHADHLAEAVARASGAALLVAQAPRAMIDLNRGEDEVDWDMFVGGPPGAPRSRPPGLRARSGLGLIPRRLPGLGELWKQRLEESELTLRIEAIHRPYHRCLAATLAELRERWGAALLIDLHSMPPLGLRGGQPAAEFVLGDRFGASCHGALIASSFAHFGEARRAAAHNRPYAGGHVLERHADPDRAIHALQLEIDRSSYLDARLSEPGAGFADMVQVLTGLVRRLASEVAELGRHGGWAAAAE